MELIHPGTQFDFMRYRWLGVAISASLIIMSALALVYPGPNYGIDFRGGTELQLRFKGTVSAGELRALLEKTGHRSADVVSVQGHPNEYILRVQEVSTLSASDQKRMEQALRSGITAAQVESMRVSPGGEKITLRFTGLVEMSDINRVLSNAGAKVRLVEPFGKTNEYRYEVYLKGIADQIVETLNTSLGARGPNSPERVEWVGPKAGQQLRDAAIKALLYAIAFIMVYVAFRFDLRFAPGGIIALAHDAFVTLGIYVIMRKEINITLVAALLTVIGYSINDTIVIYDRIRENMARFKGKSLAELINISTSQMFSRTIITSGTAVLSITPFMFLGTSAIRDIAFALIIGMALGTFSTIYVAAPVTEWMDKRFFRRLAQQKA